MSDDTATPSTPQDHRGGEWRPARGRMGLRLAIVLIVVILVVGLVLASVALGRSSSSSSKVATINVTGSGTVQGTPDTLSFQVGVQTVAASAAVALAQNNARVLLLEKALLGNGVTKKNMQTSGLNIYQNTNSHGQVTGFSVVDDLNVTTHKLKLAGAAIDAAAHAAGNGIQFNGVTFSISNESKLLAAARAKAMRTAHTEASQVAAGGGASVGSIVKVTDQENSAPNNVYFPVAYASAKASSGVPIQAGSQSINVQVTVTYALNG
jgi:uncharacterized protein YggE